MKFSGKTLVLGDLHFGKGDDYVMNFQSKFFVGVIKYVVANGIKRIIIVGDIHDKRKIVDVRVHNLFKKLCDELSAEVDEIIILRGNHDTYFMTSGEYHSIEIFFDNKRGNIKIVDKHPYIINTKDDKHFVFIPWIDDSTRAECVGAVEAFNKKGNVLFGHLELAGFDISSSYQSSSGQLDRFMFNKYDLVISGHYHLMQKKDNVLYVGSPYQLTFGEFGEHGFFVFDDDDISTMKFVKTNFSMFSKLIITETMTDEHLQKEISSLAGRICDVYIDSLDGNFIANIEERIENVHPHSVTVRVKDSEIEQVENASFDLSSQADIVRQYSENIHSDGAEEENFMKREFLRIFEESVI